MSDPAKRLKALVVGGHGNYVHGTIAEKLGREGIDVLDHWAAYDRPGRFTEAPLPRDCSLVICIRNYGGSGPAAEHARTLAKGAGIPWVASEHKWAGMRSALETARVIPSGVTDKPPAASSEAVAVDSEADAAFILRWANIRLRWVPERTFTLREIHEATKDRIDNPNQLKAALDLLVVRGDLRRLPPPADGKKRSTYEVVNPQEDTMQQSQPSVEVTESAAPVKTLTWDECKAGLQRLLAQMANHGLTTAIVEVKDGKVHAEVERRAKDCLDF